jgi:hypothetical protein
MRDHLNLRLPSLWSLIHLLILCQVLDGTWIVGHRDNMTYDRTIFNSFHEEEGG